MTRYIVSIALIIMLGMLISGFAPWYAAVFAGFFGAMPLRRNVALAFLVGFLGGFCLWFFGYYRAGGSSHPLSTSMAQLMGMNNTITLLLVGSAIGGLLAAFGAACSNVLKKEKPANRRTFG